jgi:hypothetical protein
MVLGHQENGKHRDVRASIGYDVSGHGPLVVLVPGLGDLRLPADIDRSFGRLVRGLIRSFSGWTEEPLSRKL